jgi:threonyl-tRNA synthetase
VAAGAKHRPVLVHRSIIGSVERAVAHLVEQHGGAFPGWLAPTQLMVLPVSAAELPNALALAERCADLDLRAAVAPPDRGTLGARIREARLVPYQAVIGPREAAAGQLAIRLRDTRRLPPQPASAFLPALAPFLSTHPTALWP